MSFLYPLLVSVGLPLVVVPLIIHFLNLRRQKPISWAAMIFLQESQRRNRTSILFRQLLFWHGAKVDAPYLIRTKQVKMRRLNKLIVPILPIGKF